jgi:hypothetical protein
MVATAQWRLDTHTILGKMAGLDKEVLDERI